MLLQFGKTWCSFVPPFRDHRKIVEIFLEVLVLCERENDGDFFPVFINNVLLSRAQGISSYQCYIPT